MGFCETCGNTICICHLDKEKPREFWIKEGLPDLILDQAPGENRAHQRFIHAIEFEAYQSLKTELERIRNLAKDADGVKLLTAIVITQSQNDALKAENEKLRELLEHKSSLINDISTENEELQAQTDKLARIAHAADCVCNGAMYTCDRCEALNEYNEFKTKESL